MRLLLLSFFLFSLISLPAFTQTDSDIYDSDIQSTINALYIKWEKALASFDLAPLQKEIRQALAKTMPYELNEIDENISYSDNDWITLWFANQFLILDLNPDLIEDKTRVYVVSYASSLYFQIISTIVLSQESTDSNLAKKLTLVAQELMATIKNALENTKVKEDLKEKVESYFEEKTELAKDLSSAIALLDISKVAALF